MPIPKPTCRATFFALTLILLLISSTTAQETKPPPISFDELPKGIPVIPASPTVVDIVDRPPYKQNATPAEQLVPIQTESPTRMDNKAGQDSLTKNDQEGQGIHSSFVWIVVTVSSIVIIGGIALLLIKRFRNKDKIRMRLQEEIQKHIELQEKSQPSFSGFPSN